jgi:hypothetical protein
MQALFVTLIELIFNYKRSAGRGELGLPGLQGKEASQNRREIGQRSSRGVGEGATEISVCKSSMILPTSGSGRSKGEQDALSH